MYDKLKLEIKEIINITKECPAELQQRCFELLLNNFLSNFSTPLSSQQTAFKEQEIKTVTVESQETTVAADEINENDFHVKVRRFLESNNIKASDLNRVYYKENGCLMPYYESMHSTKMSECQIRLTLLTAFENGYSTGEFVVNGELVRKRCQELKCYDLANFTTIFKTNSEIFDNWGEKYDKSTDYALSSEGKKQLAQILIKLIAEC